VSRNTVKRALASERGPQYQRQTAVNPKLEPFVEFVKDAYLVKHLRVSRILADVRSKGYSGGRSALYRWIEGLKPQREAQTVRAFQPYQTKPGEQMQYDWAEYRVPIGETISRVYVHQCILGYSRYKVFDASLAVHQSDVFTALEDAFVELSGLTERIQVDNAKVFVDHDTHEQVRWNARFLQFCGFWGVEPSRSAPYHPWSKGKVEKPFDHLEAHFIQGRQFESLAQLLSRLKEYQNTVNNSLHSVTHKSPVELFELERGVLHELPRDSTGQLKRLVGVAEIVRTVTSDCLICYAGNRYSVPHVFVRSQVWVRSRKGTSLEVYSQKGKLIATHPLCTGKGQVVLEKAHYRGYRKETDEENFQMSAHRLRERFSAQWPRLEEFLTSLKAQKRLNPMHHLAHILRILQHYSDQDCIQALEACFRYRCFSASFLQGVIRSAAPTEEAPPLALVEVPRLRIPTPPIKRDLREYQL
jgi:transposase